MQANGGGIGNVWSLLILKQKKISLYKSVISLKNSHQQMTSINLAKDTQNSTKTCQNIANINNDEGQHNGGGVSKHSNQSGYLL
jgi:hypothetical protein